MHHEGQPKSRMSMAERFAAMQQQGPAQEQAQPTSVAEDQASAVIQDALRRTTERTALARKQEALVVAPEDVVEQRVERAQEAPQDDRVEYAHLVREGALKRRQEIIDRQARIVEERSRLLALPSIPSSAPRLVEQRRDRMPTIDKFQKIFIPDFGEAQILFIDDQEEMMYFTTPEERRRIDAAMASDESLGSRESADFSQTIGLTPDQVRRILAASGRESRVSQPSQEQNPPAQNQSWQGRYSRAA